jgi:hypothetical protein
MELITSLEADIRSAGQEIPRLPSAEPEVS